MKRFLLLTISALAVASAPYAQITKGTILLGGSAGASTYTTKYSSSKENEKGFHLSPSAGLAVKDNHVIGVSLSYGHGRGKASDSQPIRDQFGGGVFYRRYSPLGKNFYLYGHGEGRYSYSRNKSSESAIYPSTSEEKSASINLYPGVAYALSKRFHLEVALSDMLSFGYRENHSKASFPALPSREDTYKSAFFQTNTNLSTNLIVGFRILLAKGRPKTQTDIPK